jgi:hypothetical protein
MRPAKAKSPRANILKAPPLVGLFFGFRKNHTISIFAKTHTLKSPPTMASPDASSVDISEKSAAAGIFNACEIQPAMTFSLEFSTCGRQR